MGPVPTEINFGDYRAVAGVKMPFTWTTTQTYMQSTIKLRVENYVGDFGDEPASKVIETTLGRALFNEALPETFPYQNTEVKKGKLGEIVNELAERYSKVEVAATLDKLKELGFHWATRSGVSISFADVDVLDVAKKEAKLAEAEAAEIGRAHV